MRKGSVLMGLGGRIQSSFRSMRAGSTLGRVSIPRTGSRTKIVPPHWKVCRAPKMPLGPRPPYVSETFWRSLSLTRLWSFKGEELFFYVTAHHDRLGRKTTDDGATICTNRDVQKARNRTKHLVGLSTFFPPALMKRLRLEKWSGQLLAARPGASASTSAACNPLRARQLYLSRRSQWTLAAAAEAPRVEGEDAAAASQRFPPLEPVSPSSFPSPPPERALSSAKLAALHARLSLSDKVPLQTLGRALVDATADEDPRFNNSNLAFLGQTLINYHISEWLMCRYPRLPMSIMYAAMSAYGGAQPLHQIARQWGVESAAVPGGEVDAGLLQFSTRKPGVTNTGFGYQRTEAAYIEKFKWRRGISSRVVLDDDFGEVVKEEPKDEETPEEVALAEGEKSEEEAPAEENKSAPLNPYGTLETRKIAENAHAQFVRATVGAIYTHCGREAVKSFVKAHVLSRQLDVSSLFSFKLPTRELARLCAREEFERPVARLLSETGRLSRTPVFVVGIYSGKDKLGEGSGPNLDAARWKAAMNSLKAWYLYSPGENTRVPSDMLAEDAKPWEPAHIDMGEIV